MSRLLSELLGAEEPMFSLAIRQLERVAANPSSDVHLSAEIIGKSQIKARELGLDPKDTTGKELYYALLAQAERHNEHLTQALGASHSEDIESLAPLIVQTLGSINIPKTAWVMKKSVAKEILRKHPPKQVMKHLKYRSIASMLKNEPIQELYLATILLESSAWHKSRLNSYKNLSPADFETRSIELISMGQERWVESAALFLSQSHHAVTYCIELGVVALLPVLGGRQKGAALVNLPMAVHSINEIRMHGSFFKMRQISASTFGLAVHKALSQGLAHTTMVAGQKIHWRIIHQYFGSQDAAQHPEFFEPHLQAEDLRWRQAEDVLGSLDPELSWWSDIGYVGVLWSEQPVSFNILDTAYNYAVGSQLEQRQTYYLREALWNEILMRYMGERPVQKKIFEQMDAEIFVPETLAFDIDKK
jgi:hypothetical protein